MNKTLSAILGTLAITLASNAGAEWSGNFGWASEYVFRGIPQSDSSAYLGVDFAQGGIDAGVWAADVSEGSEVDIYFGYGGQLSEKMSYRLGATGYLYTNDFDDTYKEINLNLGYSILSAEASVGQYDNFGGDTQEYTFFSMTAAQKCLHAAVGSFSGDFAGQYYEMGCGVETSGLDLTVTAIHGTSSLLGRADNTIVFAIGKTLDLRELGFSQ